MCIDLLISACTKDGGLYRLQMEESGKLTLRGFTPMDRPMYTIRDGESIYAIARAPFSDNPCSGLVRYHLCADGTLAQKGELQSTRGEVAPHLCVLKGNVYVVNYITGDCIRMPDTLVRHSGHSVHPARQASPHAHFVMAAPDGKLLITDLGMDAILTYDTDLKLLHRTDTKPGDGPRHLIMNEDGTVVFCANELSSTVTAYQYDGGSLTYQCECSTLPAGFAEQSTASAIRFRDGRVYVSNRGHDSVACLRWGNKGLTQERFYSCYGKGPRDFDLWQNKLICTNENSGNVSVISLLTGALLDSMELPSPICVTFLPDADSV